MRQLAAALHGRCRCRCHCPPLPPTPPPSSSLACCCLPLLPLQRCQLQRCAPAQQQRHASNKHGNAHNDAHKGRQAAKGPHQLLLWRKARGVARASGAGVGAGGSAGIPSNVRASCRGIAALRAGQRGSAAIAPGARGAGPAANAARGIQLSASRAVGGSHQPSPPSLRKVHAAWRAPSRANAARVATGRVSQEGRGEEEGAEGEASGGGSGGGVGNRVVRCANAGKEAGAGPRGAGGVCGSCWPPCAAVQRQALRIIQRPQRVLHWRPQARRHCAIVQVQGQGEAGNVRRGKPMQVVQECGAGAGGGGERGGRGGQRGCIPHCLHGMQQALIGCLHAIILILVTVVCCC